MERGVWHGCQTRHVGPWMARLADPRSSAGAREVERSETRMSGVLSLWLLSLCTSKEKVTRRKGEIGRSGNGENKYFFFLNSEYLKGVRKIMFLSVFYCWDF